MFTLLKKVNEALRHCLRSKVRHVQVMKPDAQLADLEFIKHGYSTIKHAIKPITVDAWAAFDNDPWQIAAVLMDQVDQCLIGLDHTKAIMFASPIYPENLAKGEYPTDGIWAALQFVAYTYDGQKLTVVEKEPFKQATNTVIEHQLIEATQTKVLVYPQNIERDYDPSMVYLEDYSVWVRSEFELQINKGRELLTQTLRVLAIQERIQACLEAQNWTNAAVLFGEALQADVRVVGSVFSPYFSYEDKEYEPWALLNIMRAKVGLQLLRNPNNDETQVTNTQMLIDLQTFKKEFETKHGRMPTEHEIFEGARYYGHQQSIRATRVLLTNPQHITEAVKKSSAQGRISLLCVNAKGETVPTNIADTLIRNFLKGVG